MRGSSIGQAHTYVQSIVHYIFAEAYLSISWVGPAKSLRQSADQTLSLADVPKRDHETALQPGRTLKQHFVKLVLNSPPEDGEDGDKSNGGGGKRRFALTETRKNIRPLSSTH